MSKPKIAVLIDWYLPGTKAGGPVRSVFSLLNLLKSEYDFYVLTGDHDLGSNVPYDGITPDQLFEKEGVHYCYLEKRGLGSGKTKDILDKINPDLIYLNSFWSWRFSINIIRLKSTGRISCPVVLAPRGMLGSGARSIKSFKKDLYIVLAKISGWYKSIIFHATREQEKQDVKRIFPDATIFLVPNINSSSPIPNRAPKQKNRLKLFYLSRISEVKNLHYALERLAGVPVQFEVAYDIFGNPEDREYMFRCRSISDSLPPHITINYKGELPFADVQQTILNYHCLLLPSLNENYGHSIVESLLSGCPVIISDQTPWNDVEQSGAGYAIPLAEINRFTEAVCEIAALDQVEFSQRSNAAISYISSRIDIHSILTSYRNLFSVRFEN